MIEISPLTKEQLSLVENAEREIFSDPWNRENILSHLSLSCQKSYVAFYDNTFCGYLFSTVIAGEGEVLRIATLPSFRRQGIGKKLLLQLLCETETVFLEVREKNSSARSLYESLGFFVVGTRKDYYKDPTDNAILYQYKNKG